MEYLGLVERVPSGKSYALYLPGSRPAEATAQPASIEIKRHTTAVVDPSDTWIAVDFETASGDSHSACSLGVAVVQRGAIISSGAWLIQPPGNRYDPRNTAIHGIGPRMTKRSPTYAQLYPSIEPFLESRYVLAHWAEFDIAVLRALHSYYGIQLPNARYACSCRMAQKAFPALRNHRLPTVCEHCGIDLRHHDATSDAAASAQIALRCRDAVGAATVHEAIRTLGLRVLSV
jgi:DNA polymerase-3 subunit epsilon